MAEIEQPHAALHRSAIRINELLGEGKRLERLGRRKDAMDCYRRAQKLGKSAATLRLVSEACRRLRNIPLPTPPLSAPPKPEN